jgi:hypothetical protein
VHLILAPALLQYAYKAFDAAIYCQNISDASRGSGKISEMVERID